jgi:hypothetical protein
VRQAERQPVEQARQEQQVREHRQRPEVQQRQKAQQPVEDYPSDSS